MSMTEKERLAQLAEWFQNRDSSHATVEVKTAFNQLEAWQAVYDRGFRVLAGRVADGPRQARLGDSVVPPTSLVQ